MFGGSSGLAKPTQLARAWFAHVGGRDRLVKWYPADLQDSWARIETAIVGSDLCAAIISLRQTANCADGALLLYDRISGENPGSMKARTRFQSLSTQERTAAVLTVAEALAPICEAGFMVVDWYEGNMLYGYEQKQIWRFDWELCRDGGSFILEMDFNYGTSRLMAPEEFVRGGRLDEITLVCNVDRYALLTLPDLADTLAPVLSRATYPARSGRYSTVREFIAALCAALQSLNP